MSDQHANRNGLVQTWIPVRDQSGRVHMEAHWVVVDAKATSAPSHHAA